LLIEDVKCHWSRKPKTACYIIIRGARGLAVGGINPYTLTARLRPGGLAHHEDSPRLDPTARSFAQGNKICNLALRTI